MKKTMAPTDRPWQSSHISTWILPGVMLLCLHAMASIWSLTAALAAEKVPGDSTDIPFGVIDENLAVISYSGGESFKYDVSWTGGIKIGELYLDVKKDETCASCYEIRSLITSSGGIIHALYPVRDRHITKVRGPERLPYFGEIWQKEGRSYTAHKKFYYDQKEHTILKQKDGDDRRIFQLDGTVHNEFSAFFASRVMPLAVGRPIIVPTFGDDERRLVVVRTLEETVLEDTVLGAVKTLKVSPILTFSGLYDKRGDTVIWYTDDECRVPVQVRSRIVIGSLTARLVDYTNALCDRYDIIGNSTQRTQ